MAVTVRPVRPATGLAAPAPGTYDWTLPSFMRMKLAPELPASAAGAGGVAITNSGTGWAFATLTAGLVRLAPHHQTVPELSRARLCSPAASTWPRAAGATP